MPSDRFSLPERRFDTVLLERMRFGARNHIPAHVLATMSVELIVDKITTDMILQIKGTILSKEARTETQPDHLVSRVTATEDYIAFASWWDHAKHTFRERFPKLGRRLTVRNIPVEVAHTHDTIQRVTKVYHLCPHLEQDSTRMHVRFMVSDLEDYKLF